VWKSRPDDDPEARASPASYNKLQPRHCSRSASRRLARGCPHENPNENPHENPNENPNENHQRKPFSLVVGADARAPAPRTCSCWVRQNPSNYPSRARAAARPRARSV
jgi:hypothetical protein